MGKSGNLFNDVVNKNVVMGVIVFTYTRSFDVWRELVLQSLAREGNETERMRFSRNVVQYRARSNAAWDSTRRLYRLWLRPLSYHCRHLETSFIDRVPNIV